ncbi:MULTISPECIES: SHOCT domain-containing protein [unclassified Streptomyces]|uniref:SHOCT domain-containing protein n=1 Tax=unclassified Streptomyces TaxID=2593676 RepID=UPI00341544E9
MYWHEDGAWAWMTFMPLLWILLIGLVVWAVVRLTQHSSSRATGPERDGPRGETPEDILDRRFASGEIDGDAYSAARRKLAEHRPRPR